MNKPHNPPKGSPLWRETINPVTGESSLKTHEAKLIWTGCIPGECIVKKTDNPRDVVCEKCGQHYNFIIGFHEIKNGKLIEKYT